MEKYVNGERIRIENKLEIEEEILRVNTSRLQQANNTPLREHPLQTLLGEQLDFATWEAIPKGSITLPIKGIEDVTSKR